MIILLYVVYCAIVFVTYEYAVFSAEGSRLAKVTIWLEEHTCRWWVLALAAGVEIGRSV